MRGIQGEQLLLRLILGRSRQHEGQVAFRAILELLRAEGLAGATVIAGSAGFGHDGRIHTAAIEVLATDLPVVIEVVDTKEHIDRVMPKLEPLMEGGVAMVQPVRVIHYAGRLPTAS